jgi:hypothetical protein
VRSRHARRRLEKDSPAALIGVDSDNTSVCYDRPFVEAAGIPAGVLYMHTVKPPRIAARLVRRSGKTATH